MLKKTLITLFCVASLLIVANKFVQRTVGIDAYTIFKTSGCVRNDEMGATYKIDGGPAKGSIGAEVILSDKYPASDLYKIGSRIRLMLDENPQ